jgi:hypothetical protein
LWKGMTGRIFGFKREGIKKGWREKRKEEI